MIMMSDIREQLHYYIESADEQKVAAIFTLITGELQGRQHYSQAFIDELYERSREVMSGRAETFPVEDAHAWVRAQHSGKNAV